MSNEELCALAREGNRAAQDELIEKNTGFITGIAGYVFSEYGLADKSYGIEFDELVQEGRIGLWRCIEKYDPALGASFLTYVKDATLLPSTTVSRIMKWTSGYMGATVASASARENVSQQIS